MVSSKVHEALTQVLQVIEAEAKVSKSNEAYHKLIQLHKSIRRLAKSL